MTDGRKLDTQTPRRHNLGADFGRLGIALVPLVKRTDRRSVDRLAILDGLVDLRNAIGHGNDAKIAAMSDRGFVATKPPSSVTAGHSAHWRVRSMRSSRRNSRARSRSLDLGEEYEMARKDEPVYDEVITISWGTTQVKGRIHEVYGRPDRRYVVVRLTPELSDSVVAEETTVTVPIEEVTRATSPSGSTA